ncbi:4-phytase / acid phosphatase [Dyella sp. OK004]|uniref:histidine-type phosphatase n=1 Tax=Dyella sp. OK004 TaxID=1855292 RepID=UPI0008F087D7|nr:histidine-type phosphatase [Dyella sp. OK004]SFS20082.1 4-phytase / acid phosphatase [Dyella sp. OK004]
MRLRHCLSAALILLAMVGMAFCATAAHAAEGMQLERVVLLYRHGVRTPLPGEIQLDEAYGAAWPSWPQPPSELTPHGAVGARLMGGFDRRRLAAAGLFPARGCPGGDQLWFWANTDQRTIASAGALAEGFAPGCAIAIGHLPQGSEDPLFHPIEAGATAWNAADAVAAIQSTTNGPDALTAPHADALATMAAVMGCGHDRDPDWCSPDHWRGNLSLSPDEQHMVLTGPIATTSGTAEAILMAYAEGRSMQDVGWGRADPSRLEQLSQLHALLFDIYARPDYMAERVASVMSRRIIDLLQNAKAPRLSVLVGSDNNIVALASVLGLHFKMPGYAKDDPPIGGALGIEVWRERSTGRRQVRVFYQAQSLDQLRRLQAQDGSAIPSTLDLPLDGCATERRGFCPLESVISRLRRASMRAQ